MAIEHIQLSQQAKDQLSRLKRQTGIGGWNVLCRWGLCVSLAESSAPSARKIWRVFGGSYCDLYLAALKERCIRDGLGTDEETVARQFRLHLHRGISYLAAEKGLGGIDGLISLACDR